MANSLSRMHFMESLKLFVKQVKANDGIKKEANLLILAISQNVEECFIKIPGSKSDPEQSQNVIDCSCSVDDSLTYSATGQTSRHTNAHENITFLAFFTF